MLALYRSGRQADALEAYREARRVLVEEIGVEPGPELHRLHEAILSHDPALELDPVAASLPPELEAAALTPLVGRSADEAWLGELWQTTQRSGVGAAVAITAPRGMGKTRLAAELARTVHPHGGVLYVAAHSSRPVAGAVIARALEARQPTLLVVDDLDRIDGEVRATLAELLLARPPVLVLATAESADSLKPFRFAASRVLDPLDVDGALEIVRLYAGEAVESVPVTQVLDASRGVPLRIHELAAEWSRLEAAKRVDAAAGRTAASRSALRGVQTELAGNVVDLQLARERADLIAGVGDGTARPVACPFKGLAAFGFDDADYFFGRERLVAEMVARIVGAPFLGRRRSVRQRQVVAPAAGLFPTLAAGVLPGSGTGRGCWSARARIQLDARRVRCPASRTAGRSFVVVDQFEELFTACQRRRRAGEFVDALIADGAHERAAVVVAIRPTSTGAAPPIRRCPSSWPTTTCSSGRWGATELRRAIERPAARAGLRIEPALVDALLADVEREPGGLPLLVDGAARALATARRARLRLDTLRGTGGVRGAVARLAEHAFAGTHPSQQAAARRCSFAGLRTPTAQSSAVGCRSRSSSAGRPGGADRSRC